MEMEVDGLAASKQAPGNVVSVVTTAATGLESPYQLIYDAAALHAKNRNVFTCISMSKALLIHRDLPQYLRIKTCCLIASVPMLDETKGLYRWTAGTTYEIARKAVPEPLDEAHKKAFDELRGLIKKLKPKAEKAAAPVSKKLAKDAKKDIKHPLPDKPLKDANKEPKPVPQTRSSPFTHALPKKPIGGYAMYEREVRQGATGSLGHAMVVRLKEVGAVGGGGAAMETTVVGGDEDDDMGDA